LTQNRPISTPFGESGGTKPAVLTVSVGDKVVFTNSDSFAHTSSSLGNFTTFPVGSPLTAKALKQTGATLSGGWTSGLLQPNSASQTILADKPGRYLYGCYFHYDAPMRGAIVVRKRFAFVLRGASIRHRLRQPSASKRVGKAKKSASVATAASSA
jgi:plastocyanin